MDYKLDMGRFLLYCIFTYFIVRGAVKNGMKQAYKEIIDDKTEENAESSEDAEE